MGRGRRIVEPVSPPSDAPDIAALIAMLRVDHQTDDAVDELASLGEPCIEPLLATLQSPTEPERVREAAAIALGRIAPGGVACLLEALDGDDDELADLAAWGLRWPPRSGLAEPVLGAMLVHLEARRRLRGLRGLGYIGVDLTALDPRILECARHDEPRIRVAAFAVIERVGLDAPGVRAVLDEGLADPDRDVREAATRALEQVGEGPRR
jgi:HEAT repeat protein